MRPAFERRADDARAGYAEPSAWVSRANVSLGEEAVSEETPPVRAHCITITIIGALPLPMTQYTAPQFDDFIRHVQEELFKRWPEFLPASPPMIVQWSELRDDWIKTSPCERR